MLGSESPYTCHTAQKKCPGAPSLEMIWGFWHFCSCFRATFHSELNHSTTLAKPQTVLFYDALCHAKPWRPNDIQRSSNFQITRTEELYKGSFILSMILQVLCILASTRLDSSTFKLGFPNLPVVPARSMLLTEDMSIQPGQIGIFRRHLLHCDSFDGRTM